MLYSVSSQEASTCSQHPFAPVLCFVTSGCATVIVTLRGQSVGWSLTLGWVGKGDVWPLSSCPPYCISFIHTPYPSDLCWGKSHCWGTSEHLVSGMTLTYLYQHVCLEEKKDKVGLPQIRQTQSKGLNKENHVLSGTKIGYRVHFQDFMTQ